MAKAGSYGWTPEQLARINARREVSGKQPYIDKRMQEQDYAMKYLGETDMYSKRKKPSGQASPDENEEEMSLAERQAKRTNEFREQFSPKGSMAVEYGVKSKAPSLIKSGIKGGVGTSMMQDSYNRIG